MYRFIPILLSAAALASDWPQWRGPSGNGVSEDAHPPLSWSATENIAWSIEVPGTGHSQPVVAGKRVFLTTAIEGEALPDNKAPKHMAGTVEFTHPDWS